MDTKAGLGTSALIVGKQSIKSLCLVLTNALLCGILLVARALSKWKKFKK